MREDFIDEIYEEEDTQKDKYLTFNLGEESYGIEIRHVTEIIGVQPITVVPELPDYICGIINLRGKIIPVMDVRLRFKKKYRDYDDRTCVIVTETGDNTVGLIVDSVSEVLTIPETDVVPPPKMGKELGKYIKNIGKTGDMVKLILDCETLLSREELESYSLVS